MENAAAEVWRPHQPARHHQSGLFCAILTFGFGDKRMW